MDYTTKVGHVNDLDTAINALWPEFAANVDTQKTGGYSYTLWTEIQRLRRSAALLRVTLRQEEQGA